MTQIIETERVLLRPFCIDDIDRFAKICENPNVMRYIGDGQPVGLESITEKILEWIELYKKQRYGLMALVLKETNTLIGFCGLIHQIIDEVPYIELGYRLDEAYWGKGIATEAAIAIRDYAFNVLDIPLLISIIHHQNKASKCVAKKVGMQLMKRTNFKNVLVDVFSLKRDDMSEKLFSYGTLQYETVQLANFGRKLTGAVDTLSKFELSELKITDPDVIAASGKDIHPVVIYTGEDKDKVQGMVFEVSVDELKQADSYEVSDYKRVKVRLDSGVSAWVYIHVMNSADQFDS